MLRKIGSLAICQMLLVAHTAGRLLTDNAPQEISRGAVGGQKSVEISDIATRLASIEKSIEARRKEENIPGVALVIVASDKVIYVNGLGLRDIEQSLPVTPDTLFEIGSTTKAFTAMAAVISVDEGKLELDDPPRKFLPYFKLRDANADSAVTIRDLLSHRTGLKAYDDGAWIDNEKRSREDVIKAVMMNKASAKFREKFQYNNVMFAAAGECVAKAQNSTWEDIIRSRIFGPLRMNASAPSLKELRDGSNFSLGYQGGKAPRPVRHHDLTGIAPAGAIISNARDMAQWLRLMIGGGVIDGKRLVSEKSFNELLTKQISVGADADYGLGWGLFPWHGRKLVSHTGGTFGFSSLVELMPEQRLGFVFLVNVSESKLLMDIRGIIWGNLLDIH